MLLMGVTVEGSWFVTRINVIQLLRFNQSGYLVSGPVLFRGTEDECYSYIRSNYTKDGEVIEVKLTQAAADYIEQECLQKGKNLDTYLHLPYGYCNSYSGSVVHMLDSLLFKCKSREEAKFLINLASEKDLEGMREIILKSLE